MKTYKKASLLLLTSAILILQGCSTGVSSTTDTNSASNATQAPYKGSAKTASMTQSASAAPMMGDGYASNTIESDLFTMTKRVPSSLSIGETFSYEYVVTAKEDLTNLVVTDTLPKGISYVSSSPTAAQSGSDLTWDLGDLDANESAYITLKTKADSVGSFANCASVTAAPRACLVVVVGEPELMITKTVADATLLLGETADFTITITNTGNTVAKNVVVSDTLPKGLRAQSPLVFQAGDLAPNESKSFQVLAGTTKTGEFLNTVCAVGSNVGEVCDDASVVVNEAGLTVTKEGTAEQFVGKPAKYKIVVTNTGDIDLTNIVVTDTVGQGMTIKSASGAVGQGNVAVWDIPTLKAGASKTFNVTTHAALAGNYCNSVTVEDADMKLSDSAQACTVWKGYPAVLLEVIDTEDPLLEGASSSYIIRVTNQGNAPDYNVAVSAMIAKELKVLSANGVTASTINGSNVAFGVVPVINPKEVLEFEIKVKAETIGGGRSNFELDTKLLQGAISETEATQVY